MMRRHDEQNAPATKPDSRPYTPPRLIVYGHVRQLTQGGSVLSGENAGAMSSNLP